MSIPVGLSALCLPSPFTGLGFPHHPSGWGLQLVSSSFYFHLGPRCCSVSVCRASVLRHELVLLSNAGRDAARAFVSGDFTESGLVEDVSGLSPSEILALHEWLDFYKKEYIFKGKLIGMYYDHNGEPNQALSDVELAVMQGRKLKAESELENNLFPPCNSEWSSAKGGRVWCSSHSGGVKRSWAGVPRKLYKPGSKSHRCVCVRPTGPPSNQPNSAQNRGDLDNPSLQEYAGCHSLSDACALPDT
ncbi:neuferricin [Chiloscyllium plagiosum]|uniref:neuferricin n=1 Tax=Chiloscyllium plagiosum TaxID=36176 RepID=UPI001CB87A91|nr:neuferricin [Chiloscyllium plagiosum]